MGVTKPYQLKTRNGQLIETNLFDSLSMLRTPEKREEIIKGQFHKVATSDGTGEITVEKPFLYTDFERNEVILVKPLSERYTWRKTSAELEQIVKQLPNTVSPPENRFKRVVFGLGELREKLVARKAGIDDRAIELFKVLLAYEHPIILQQPRLNINLHTIDEQSLTFIASYEHDKTAYQLSMPRQLADNLLDKPKELKQWVADSHKDNIFELEQNHDHWVNFRRWSPTETALNLLSDYAEQVRQKKDIDPTSTDFQTMLKGLPSGNHMPSWAKQALRDLFVWAKDKGNGQLQDKLFELRFDKQLDDDWYLNDDPNDIDTLWKLLQNLPDTNVEGNTRLDKIDLDSQVGGAYYNPNADQIVIGTVFLPGFEGAMRHEVGHAVQSKLDQAKQNLISNWLKEQFGWQIFGLDDSGIDAWVNLMGGYGNITEVQKQEVRQYLRDSKKNQPANLPSGHPWYSSNFGPRLALEQTGDPLWDNYHQWYSTNGLAFFRDYDYQLFTVVSESTFDLVEQMPSSYALRSPFEFFAELYALFYNLADSRWGNIPQSLCDWLWENIGSAMPIPGKHYMLRNKQSRQVIDVFSFRQENSADVVQWPSQNNDNQQWLLEDLGNGYYTLTAKHSGKALNVRGASTLDGVQIEQYEKNGTDAQQWELEETEDGYYILLSKTSGMALTVSGNEANNGSPIQQQTNQESDIQEWRFEQIVSPIPIPGKYYILRNKKNRLVINVSQNSKENSADVIQWSDDQTDNERWLLEDIGNGYYTLAAKHSGKALNVRDASTQDGTPIEQYDKNGTDAQQWKLEETEDGYYILLSKASGMALTGSGNNAQRGSLIQQHPNEKNDIQKWRFEQIYII
ncbi:RICIN domain-containing protein [Nostoc sp.]|uniref:RICIN domain-containing protein n=1 Tax=Nostoc sp. TaxID=1180 RepID=UPI002FFC92FD